MCMLHHTIVFICVKAATGNSELYTTESYQGVLGELKPGDGFVGKANSIVYIYIYVFIICYNVIHYTILYYTKAYKEAHAMFIPDLSAALDSEYPRKQLATKYGVVSLALKPMGDGVMEIGTSNRCRPRENMVGVNMVLA